MASSYLQVLSDQHTASGVVPPGVSKPNSTFGQSSNLRVQLGKPSKLRGESKNVQTSRPNYPEHIRQNMDRERSTELRYLWTDSPIGHVSLPCLLANLFYKLFPFLPRASGLTVGQLAGWRIFFLQVLHCAIRIWRRCRDWMKCGVEMCWEKTWKGGILGPRAPSIYKQSQIRQPDLAELAAPWRELPHLLSGLFWMITAIIPPLRNVQVAVKKNLRPVFFTRKNGSPLITVFWLSSLHFLTFCWKM